VASGEPTRAELEAATERWFLRRGIPHFTDDYDARHDVLTRALPLLVLVFLVELTGALSGEWTWWVNALAALGGFAVLLGAWGAANRVRDRSFFARPDRVGFAELAVFVIAPAALPLIFNGDTSDAELIAIGNLVLIVLVYFTTSYGLIPMVRWATLRIFRELGATVRLGTRALPMMLLFFTFLFINAEVWQVGHDLEGPFLATVIAVLALTGSAFLAARLPREIEQLARFELDDSTAALLVGTPVERVIVSPEMLATVAPLGRREWGNVALVLVFAQGLQAVLVSVTLGVFFVVFGLLTITPATIEVWTTAAPNVLADFDLWGRQVVLSQELLQVSAFLATVSGLYFSVYALTDSTYREEFFDEVCQEVRVALAVRCVYRAALASGDGSTT
jgi:hypothetical protein